VSVSIELWIRDLTELALSADGLSLLSFRVHFLLDRFAWVFLKEQILKWSTFFCLYYCNAEMR